jgi:glycosyltransferase involved in cell wall biosynthesis
MSSGVIAQSNEQAALLRRDFGLRPTVISNYVLGSRFVSARATSFEERDIDVVWVGSIDNRKRPEMVLELGRQLPERRFAMIGGPLPGGEDYYAKIAQEAEAVTNVEFVGFVDPGDLPSWFGRARMLLHTAGEVRGDLMKEGFPNVFLEAWSSGIPVISLTADPSQLLSRDGFGVLCRAESEAREQIEKLARSEVEWCKYRERVLEYASSRDISAEGVLDEMLAILAGDRA